MKRALDINTPAHRQLFAAVRFKRIFARDHKTVVACEMGRRPQIVDPGNTREGQRIPFASITWIRFNGSAALPRTPSQPSPGQVTPEPVGSPMDVQNLGPGSESVKTSAHCQVASNSVNSP